MLPLRGPHFIPFFGRPSNKGANLTTMFGDVTEKRGHILEQIDVFFWFFLSALVPVVTHFNQTTMDSLNKKKMCSFMSSAAFKVMV